MKKSKFDKLSPELQKEYLERGGIIEPNRKYFCNYMRFSAKTALGKEPKGRKKIKRKVWVADESTPKTVLRKHKP